jgi:arginyl-tRNA--protein-N-Asp/Glu arginylyltransferase
VVWLRYRLEGFTPSTQQSKLMKKIRDLEISFKPLVITEELEELFRVYREQLDFNTSESLHRLLYDEIHPEFVPPGIFDSFVVQIRKEDKLIAAGVLDMGEKSSAGIINFYDPVYKKYSLGKCLMLIKMGISMQRGMQYYYPGYIAYDYSKFDYKLFIGTERAELYDPANRKWIPYSNKLFEDIAQQYYHQIKKADQ